ncbi:hypothetical protein CDAR_565451 [Caerostris darwini]|uniref:Uncharacterized protein n=1 Tax=Caerostris darwini TaxID=1538125 RepID=A0AAV4TWC7_9ARAC|nr:hypothetical protein CDAR_565451 [Caerostris darwini]
MSRKDHMLEALVEDRLAYCPETLRDLGSRLDERFGAKSSKETSNDEAVLSTVGIDSVTFHQQYISQAHGFHTCSAVYWRLAAHCWPIWDGCFSLVFFFAAFNLSPDLPIAMRICSHPFPIRLGASNLIKWLY